MIKSNLIKALANLQYREAIRKGELPLVSTKKLLVTVISVHNNSKPVD